MVADLPATKEASLLTFHTADGTRLRFHNVRLSWLDLVIHPCKDTKILSCNMSVSPGENARKYHNVNIHGASCRHTLINCPSMLLNVMALQPL